MDVKLENVTTGPQIARVLRLIEKIWPDHYTPIIGRAQVEYMMSGYQSEEGIKSDLAGGVFYYILARGNADIGYLAYEEKPEGMYLSKLYLLEEQRGKGLGKFMAMFVEQKAAEKGVKRVFLRVNRNNLSSIKAYEKMGYIKTEEMKTDIGGGFVMDDYVMQKML